MILKERLEELIEEGATIWSDGYRNSHIKIKLTKHFVAKLGDSFDLYGYGCDYFGVPLSHLFETKEEAEWHKEFGYIERTERLELPTWEEFLKMEKLHSFKSKEGKLIVYFYDNNTIYLEDEDWNILRKSLTKENYTLACRKAKELFLGEKK